MIAFIDEHREVYGVEPICKRAADRPVDLPRPRRAAGRSRQAAGAGQARCSSGREIRRVFEENFGVYGVRKVWRQLGREGIGVARCTVARLMRTMGLQGGRARQAGTHHDQRQGRAVPARPR